MFCRGFLSGARGFSAGYPRVINAWGSTSSGSFNVWRTVFWQKMGAQYQHAPNCLA